VSGPMPKLDKKMMPCFQHAKQNCPKKADECQYSHDRAVIKADERIERISGLNLLDSAIHSDCVVISSLILQDGTKIYSRHWMYSR